MSSLIEPREMFQNRWNPEHYYRDYYGSEVQSDEIATIRFLTREYRRLFKDKEIPLLLEFGSGPTFHHLFPAIPYVKEVHMSDFLEKNLEELEKWLSEDPESYNWDKFVKYTLECEGRVLPSNKDVEKRKEMTRKKVKKLLKVDAKLSNPGGKELRDHYPVVMSCYCADSATTDKSQWELYMKNIISMIKPGGAFITTALAETNGYHVGSETFPSANVSLDDLAKIFAIAFPHENTTIDLVRFSSGEHSSQGYSGVLLASSTGKK